jgi:hypothetical protein
LSWCLRGCPTGFVLRNISSTSLEYIASFVMGLIFARISLARQAFGLILSMSENSAIV